MLLIGLYMDIVLVIRQRYAQNAMAQADPRARSRAGIVV